MTIAFVFPGQGSQELGMLKSLAEQHPEVRDTFAEASEYFGADLWSLAQEGPEEAINRTEITQPLMLAADVACWRTWCARSGAQPAWLAGHSLGEYAAYVAAGSLSLVDAMRIVKLRGELMRDACPGGIGKMAAVLGLEDDALIDVCNAASQGQVVQAVNFNAPGQVVIAGHSDAVERAIALARERGARKAMPLPVSVPCHSDLMRPASERLQGAILAADIRSPSVPVVNNVDAGVAHAVSDIQHKLVVQLYSPVRWVASVERMASAGVTTWVECGPGKVLSGLGKRIVKGASLFSLQDADAFAQTLSATGDMP